MSLETTVQSKQDGRYVTTVPKRLGDKYELAGTDVEWRVDSRDKLSLILDIDADAKTTTFHKAGNGQHTVAIPTGLAAAMRLGGAVVKWDEPTLTRLTIEVIERGGDE